MADFYGQGITESDRAVSSKRYVEELCNEIWINTLSNLEGNDFDLLRRSLPKRDTIERSKCLYKWKCVKQEPTQIGVTAHLPQKVLLVQSELTNGDNLFRIVYTVIETTLLVVGFYFSILTVANSHQPNYGLQQLPSAQYEYTTDFFDTTAEKDADIFTAYSRWVISEYHRHCPSGNAQAGCLESEPGNSESEPGNSESEPGNLESEVGYSKSLAIAPRKHSGPITRCAYVEVYNPTLPHSMCGCEDAIKSKREVCLERYALTNTARFQRRTMDSLAFAYSLEHITLLVERDLVDGRVLRWKGLFVCYHVVVLLHIRYPAYPSKNLIVDPLERGIQFHGREIMLYQKSAIRLNEFGSGGNRKRRQSKQCCSNRTTAKRHCSTPSYYQTSTSSSVGDGSGSNDGNEEDDWKNRKRPPRSAPPFLDRDAPVGNKKSKKRKREKTREQSLRRLDSPKDSYTPLDSELEPQCLGKTFTLQVKARQWEEAVLEECESPTRVELPPDRRKRRGWSDSIEKNWPVNVDTLNDSTDGIVPKDPPHTAHPSPLPAVSVRKVLPSEVPSEVEKIIPHSTKPAVSRLPGNACKQLLQDNGPSSPLVPGSDLMKKSVRRIHSNALLTPGVSYADKVKCGIRQDGVGTLFNAPHPNLPVDPAAQLVTEVKNAASCSPSYLTSMATGGVLITHTLTPSQVLAVCQSHDTVADASTGDHLPSGDVSPPEIEALVTTGNGSLDQHQCSDAHSPTRESIVVPPVRVQLLENDREAVQMVTLKPPVPECMCPNNKTKVFLREYLLTQQRDETAVLPGSAEQENTDHVQSLDASEARVELVKPVSVSEPTLSQSLCLVVNGNELCFVQTNQAQVEEDSIPYGDEPPQTSEGCLLPFAVPRSPLPLPDSHSDHQPIARVHIDNGNYFSFNCLTEVIVHDRINQADHEDDERASFLYLRSPKYPGFYPEHTVFI